MVNKNGTSKYHKARTGTNPPPAFPIINSLPSASPGQCFSVPVPPQRRWGRCPQAAPGPHGVPGAEVNAKISVFWGRRQGGERQKKKGGRAGEDTEGWGGEWDPDADASWDEGRKRRERKYRFTARKTEGSIKHRRGGFTLRELLSEVWRRE